MLHGDSVENLLKYGTIVQSMVSYFVENQTQKTLTQQFCEIGNIFIFLPRVRCEDLDQLYSL